MATWLGWNRTRTTRPLFLRNGFCVAFFDSWCTMTACNAHHAGSAQCQGTAALSRLLHKPALPMPLHEHVCWVSHHATVRRLQSQRLSALSSGSLACVLPAGATVAK